MNDETSHISTYPVGFLAAIKHKRYKPIHAELWRYLRARNWRGVRNYFNGYLAEWHYPPEGMVHHRCGRGWTRKAAIRRLGMHIATVNAPELNKGKS